jgi:hypothetical protein
MLSQSEKQKDIDVISRVPQLNADLTEDNQLTGILLGDR